MSTHDTQIISDASLENAGFSREEIQAGSTRADGYVGEKNGVKYYRAQNEFDINFGEHKTREVRLPNQFGDHD